VPDPLNVNFALESIIGKTFVRDAAASTIGVEPPAELAVLEDAAVLDGAAALAEEDELLELLLPQPAANAAIAIVITDTMACLVQRALTSNPPRTQ